MRFGKENAVKVRVVITVSVLLAAAAGCTDLKPLETRVEELQGQVDRLQADLLRSANNAAAANKTTAASAAAASGDSKQALAIGEKNTAAIDALNAKIEQMFRKRPAEQ
jgi:outer membrane murein-binding lipoprotein Lpp